ncbi:hypothetical protein HYT55_03050 [Candidatus Woesearchaeota archaeon]|nr:hypothetical protein [Candidatus Woesearchaeota archaeon]
MKFGLLVNPGLGKLAQQELFELTQIKGEVVGDAVVFSTEKHEPVEKLLFHAQTPRRLVLLLGHGKDQDQFVITEKVSSYFHTGQKYKIEVENIKGQDNRQTIAKKIYDLLQATLNSENIVLTVDYKRPDLVVIVYFSGNEFLLGVDLCGQEINSREYRLFPHSGSLKGDLAYWIVRKSGYVPDEKIIVGFVKDGAVAIEAGLYALRQAFRDIKHFSLYNILSFSSTHRQENNANHSIKIDAFDESLPNVLAARKNVVLAHLKNNIDIQRHSLEDLDARYTESSIDRMIFTITSKDEEKINELYYQAGLLLKAEGTLLILSRDQWELPLSEKFILCSEEKLQRGEGSSKTWLLKKK